VASFELSIKTLKGAKLDIKKCIDFVQRKGDEGSYLIAASATAISVEHLDKLDCNNNS
jgi:hypothetical protein